MEKEPHLENESSTKKSLACFQNLWIFDFEFCGMLFKHKFLFQFRGTRCRFNHKVNRKNAFLLVKMTIFISKSQRKLCFDEKLDTNSFLLKSIVIESKFWRHQSRFDLLLLFQMQFYMLKFQLGWNFEFENGSLLSSLVNW